MQPALPITSASEQSQDWPWGDHVPLMDDFLIRRLHKFLITLEDNLEALRYLLAPPTNEDMARFRDHPRRVKALAAERDLLTVGTYGTVGDLAVWLCGLQELMILTVDALSDYVRLREQAPVAIAAGEVLTRRQSFFPWLQNGALDVVQPDLIKFGVLS